MEKLPTGNRTFFILIFKESLFYEFDSLTKKIVLTINGWFLKLLNLIILKYGEKLS